MKKIIFVFTIVFSCHFTNLQAQDFASVYLKTGYNVSFGDFDKINGLINTFNTTNETNLKKITSPNGISVGLGGYYNYFMLDLGFNQNLQRRSETFENMDGEDVEQTIKFSYYNYHLGLGLAIPFERKNWLFGLGGTIEQTTFRARTRPKANRDYIEAVEEKEFSSSVFLQFVIGDIDRTSTKLYIEPYYTFGFSPVDIFEFNKALNPTTYQNDPPVIEQGFSHFGIRISIASYINFR